MQHRPSIQWFRVTPFLAMHVACGAVLWVGWSWTSLGVCLAVYFARVFGLTAFYHRYFSHRSFKTSRWLQFLGALLGNAAAQRGPIWWAAHHRNHHRHSDGPRDSHSPHAHGILWSHMLWFMTRENYHTNHRYAKEWMKYPELRFINRFDFLVPALLAVGLFGLGEVLRYAAPSLATNGWQLLVWGFLISTTLLWHGTFAINSMAHICGTRRFATKDESRNNWWLALITFGEGWHNNHHHYPSAARQGFYWWELDVTFYVLTALSWCGLVWDLRRVPQRVFDETIVAPSSGT